MKSKITITKKISKIRGISTELKTHHHFCSAYKAISTGVNGSPRIIRELNTVKPIFTGHLDFLSSTYFLFAKKTSSTAKSITQKRNTQRLM